ncbi:transposase [Streptomyces sp. NPDC059489]|uniref:transposase n=1 Tax=Streptomyces sp. NPDC059489 TaxID=3346849 RepID=UPI0036D01F8D
MLARLIRETQDVTRPKTLIVDDTDFVKDQDASARVSRQHTVTTGKVTNCQVGASRPLARERASAAIDWKLSCRPGRTRPHRRRLRPGPPAACGARFPLRLFMRRSGRAMDMIDEVHGRGVDVPLVVADARYGETTAFRLPGRAGVYVIQADSRHPLRQEALRRQTPRCGLCRPRPTSYRCGLRHTPRRHLVPNTDCLRGLTRTIGAQICRVRDRNRRPQV